MQRRKNPIVPFNYFGGKGNSYNWIISYFPSHRIYIEPFCGSAVVLLNKPRSEVEIINDLDDKIVNFFKVVRDNRKELEEKLKWTPYSRTECHKCLRIYQSEDRYNKLDDIEKARVFYVVHVMGRFGVNINDRDSLFRKEHASKRKFTKQYYKKIDLFKDIKTRLKGVVIENRDAIELIKDYADNREVLFYIDPPYILNVRPNSKKMYSKEMMENNQHKELLKLLLKVKGKVIISSYQNKLYDDLLKGWTTSYKEVTHQSNRNRKETDRGNC